MKMIFLILLMMLPSLFAELPESIPEFICDEADMTNYVEWCTCDGIYKFPNKVFLFSEATVATALIKGLNEGHRNSYRIFMSTNIVVEPNRKNDMQQQFYSMHKKLCSRFDSKNLGKVHSSGDRLIFAGKDIDGLRWDVCAIAVKTNNQWYVTCEFVNEYHKAGKFISCEDFFVGNGEDNRHEQPLSK